MDGFLRELPPLDDDDAIEFHLPERSGDDTVPRPVTPPDTSHRIVLVATAGAAIFLLLRLYNQGIPFFTKEAF
jgi:hypothetical protein